MTKCTFASFNAGGASYLSTFHNVNSKKFLQVHYRTAILDKHYQRRSVHLAKKEDWLTMGCGAATYAIRLFAWWHDDLALPGGKAEQNYEHFYSNFGP